LEKTYVPTAVRKHNVMEDALQTDVCLFLVLNLRIAQLETHVRITVVTLVLELEK
jgi:glycerol-3-phosphate responsive antiterminator